MAKNVYTKQQFEEILALAEVKEVVYVQVIGRTKIFNGAIFEGENIFIQKNGAAFKETIGYENNEIVKHVALQDKDVKIQVPYTLNRLIVSTSVFDDKLVKHIVGMVALHRVELVNLHSAIVDKLHLQHKEAN